MIRERPHRASAVVSIIDASMATGGSNRGAAARGPHRVTRTLCTYWCRRISSLVTRETSRSPVSMRHGHPRVGPQPDSAPEVEHRGERMWAVPEFGDTYNHHIVDLNTEDALAISGLIASQGTAPPPQSPHSAEMNRLVD